MEAAEAPSRERICEEYGISDPDVVSNMLVTVKRRFQAALTRRLRDSAMSDEEAEAELKEIRRLLPKLAQDGA